VVSANRQGIYKALSYLIENNHKKIGFIGNINWRYSYQERFDAFCYYMKKFNLPINNDFVWLDSDYNDLSYFRKKIKQFYPSEDTVTAWVCVNDVMAIDIINTLKEAGYKVPDDFSVIGFDNTASYPGAQALTTLGVQVKALGQRAIEQLMCRIEFPDKAFEILSIDTKLLIRDSVKMLL
jgi:LacI family transcriptional regulator